MARRRRAQKRQVVPDSKFGSEVVSKLISKIMRDGKRSVAESIVYQAFETIQGKIHKDPLDFFFRAVDIVKPTIEVSSRRVGGATYQVPIEVRPERQLALALNWIIEAAQGRQSEKTMKERLAHELMDIINNKGGAIRKRDDVRRMAESNRAFSHYRPS